MESRSSPSEFLLFENLIPPILSTIAGLVDVIGFLTLKLFTAHITGNLVLIAALAVGRESRLDQLLAIPAFVVAVSVVWLLARGSQRRGPSLGRLLLFVQFVLLACVLVVSVLWHPSGRPRSFVLNLTAMIAVAGMATQYSFLSLVMPGAPSTAVMTSNLTNVTIALLDTLHGKPSIEKKYKPLHKTLPVLAGFLIGCAVGAIAVFEFGDWAWSVPVVLAAFVTTILPKGTRRSDGFRNEDQPL